MKEFFTNLKRLNWKIVALFAIVIFYIGISVIYARDEKSPIHYGGDYLAFWSAGKVADKMGFSQIYDLENLRLVQEQTLLSNGIISESDNRSFLTLPAPYLSFFLLPFSWFSRFEIEQSYWLWTILSLAVLAGYLYFGIKKVDPGKRISPVGYELLALALASYPVFANLINGQLNVFLMVCTGEFFRNAMNKKPTLSGIWLAGLLLKPQLLILIVPVLLLKRCWKVVLGFFIISGFITLISMALSGVEGFFSLIKLWTNWGETNAITAPAAMINWRMIGVQLNLLTNTSIGWFIAALGIFSTLTIVYFIVRFIPRIINHRWILGLLGIFCATLVVTWHSHFHMALILIPLLLYVYADKLLPERIIFLWVVLPPCVWVAALIASSAGLPVDQIAAVALSGLFSCNMILLAVMKNLKPQNAREQNPIVRVNKTRV